MCNIEITGTWLCIVLYASLDMGIFFKPRSHVSIIIEKKIKKSPSEIMFTVTVTAVHVLENEQK